MAYLLSQGVQAHQIVAITFTNRAANEMKERTVKLLGGAKLPLRISTMHAFCVRLLRSAPGAFDLPNDHFSIADEDDAKRYCLQALTMVTGKAIKDLQSDTSSRGLDACRRAVSKQKNQLVTPDDMVRSPQANGYDQYISRVYRQYNEVLKKANAVDFDDLIFKAVVGLRNPETRDSVSQGIQHLLVDEYQDTNAAQIEMLQYLASKYRNIYCVGDQNQSIFRFRFADNTCEGKFFKAFPEAKIYSLQGNFRSTAAITALANRIIEDNPQDIVKKIVATRHQGGLPRYVQRRDSADEADFILDEIYRLVRQGKATWKDCVVMYRTRFQSRALEVAAVHRNVPYRVVGALGFYSRTIVKDVVSYLRLRYNHLDDASFMRLHNQPRRGIGDNGMAQFCRGAEEKGACLYDYLRKGWFVDAVTGPANQGFRQLHRLLKGLRKLDDSQIGPLVDATIREAGFYTVAELADGKNKKKGGFEQTQQLDELVTAAYEFDSMFGTGLKGFLDHVALLQQADGGKETDDRVLLMTVHAAKGQEFAHVWVAGCCDGLIPIKAHDDGEVRLTPDELVQHTQEERRIFYVAVTRAKDTLTLTWPATRNARGSFVPSDPTPFLDSAGPDLLQQVLMPTEAADPSAYQYRGPDDYTRNRWEKPNRRW